MAVSSTLSCQTLPILHPLRTNSSISSSEWLSPNHRSLVPSKAATTRRRTFYITLSYKSTNGLASDKKRELLERYGLNPDEFLSEPSPKPRRRKGPVKTGRGKPEKFPQESQPLRETHRLLQVLGGKVRRKKLLSPKGMDVRPMMEVVKGAAFGILQAAGGSPASLRPGRWLDLYSGTGSVGIEAISRGCSEVHFVEMDPWVVSDVLRPNLESTGFLDVSVIHTMRVENFLEQTENFVDGAFDYISVTPPYMEVDYGILMNQVANSSAIGDDSFVVVEYPLRTEMQETCSCLLKIADRRFGRTHLAIYGPTWAQKQRKSEGSHRSQIERV